MFSADALYATAATFFVAPLQKNKHIGLLKIVCHHSMLVNELLLLCMSLKKPALYFWSMGFINTQVKVLIP